MTGRRTTAWVAAIGCLAIALVVGIALGASASISDESNVPAWIEAVATVAALAAASAAAIFAATAFHLESSREERWAADAKRAQASSVAAWPGPVKIAMRYDPASSFDFADGAQGFSVFVRNASDVPVYEVIIPVCLRATSGTRKWTRSIDAQRLPVLEPEHTRKEVVVAIDPSWRRADLGLEPNELVEFEVEVEVVFRDSAGVRWHRDRRGGLREIPDHIEID